MQTTGTLMGKWCFHLMVFFVCEERFNEYINKLLEEIESLGNDDEKPSLKHFAWHDIERWTVLNNACEILTLKLFVCQTK